MSLYSRKYKPRLEIYVHKPFALWALPCMHSLVLTTRKSVWFCFMWCMILYSSVFLVYLCIYIHIYRGMLLFGQNMHSAWPEEAKRRLCMSRVTCEIRPPAEAEDAVLMVWASKEHFRKSVQASNTRSTQWEMMQKGSWLVCVLNTSAECQDGLLSR